MTAEVLAFLGGAPGPISLFEAWEEAVLACGETPFSLPFSPSPGGLPSGGLGLCWPPWDWAAGWSTPASSRPWSPIPAAGPTICS